MTNSFSQTCFSETGGSQKTQSNLPSPSCSYQLAQTEFLSILVSSAPITWSLYLVLCLILWDPSGRAGSLIKKHPNSFFVSQNSSLFHPLKSPKIEIPLASGAHSNKVMSLLAYFYRPYFLYDLANLSIPPSFCSKISIHFLYSFCLNIKSSTYGSSQGSSWTTYGFPSLLLKSGIGSVL